MKNVVRSSMVTDGELSLDDLDDVAESDADPEIAAIYADIKGTLGVPAVNLIWRHLATLPSALPAVWHCLKPLLASVELAERARVINAQCAIEEGGWTRTEFERCVPNDGARTTIDRVLANYEMSNPGNVLALTVLQRVASNSLDAGTEVPTPRNAPPPAPPIPGLVAVSAMSPEIIEAGRALTAIGTPMNPRTVTAGVPRHLAHWPAFLALCVEQLRDIEPSIANRIDVVSKMVLTEAADLARYAAPLSDTVTAASLRRSVAAFTAPIGIPNFMVKVATLRSWLRTARET